MSLPSLMVAPNGARIQKSDHPAVPITLGEIVEDAKRCYDAGADGLHLHIRNRDGRHLLDAEGYRNTLAALSKAVPSLRVQITTEAAGRYDPAFQRDIALRSGCSLVSVSVREMCQDSIESAAAFYRTCQERGIAIQHILYDIEDADLLKRVLPEGLFQDANLQLLFVLGRHSSTQNSDPEELSPFLDWLGVQLIWPDWALCAFGPAETRCLLRSVANGGKCRIGFENSVYRADGSVALSNEERVSELKQFLKSAS